MKQKIRLTESQLHDLIKEAVTEIFDTDYDGFHLGNHEGLAHRAKKSLKGLLSPKYRARKERQEKLFHDTYGDYQKAQSENNPKYSDYKHNENGYSWGLKGHKFGTHSGFEDIDKDSKWEGNRRQDIQKWSPEDYEEFNKKEHPYPDYGKLNLPAYMSPPLPDDFPRIKIDNEDRVTDIIKESIRKVLC